MVTFNLRISKFLFFLITCASAIAICALPAVGAREDRASDSAPQRVLLTPRFFPGQVFRYAMEFATTTTTSRSGLTSDPQGPARLAITWDSTIRIEVLPVAGNVPGAVRLRTTYEKSSATVQTDTVDPGASATQRQYQNLEGKVIEFTLDAAGKVISVSGVEGIVEGDKASQAARQWISELDATAGAPRGGVIVGQSWTSDQPADSLPFAGMVWRTTTQYLRNDSCHPPNPDAPGTQPQTDSAETISTSETCAVLLSQLNLARQKWLRNPTPDQYRKNGVSTSGKWDGTAQSLIYISLRTGTVVSITQAGTQNMDVTLTSAQKTSMHYAGTIESRSQVALLAAVSR